jgi:hypothetical protein
VTYRGSRFFEVEALIVFAMAARGVSVVRVLDGLREVA